MSIIVRAAPLQGLCAELFSAVGTPADIADAVAQSLVRTNLMGHDSHGVIRVKQYRGMIRDGMLKPAARPRLRKRFGATAMVTNGYGFGQIGASFAADLAVEIGREHGIAAVSLGQTGHIGRLGEYTHSIAARGLIGIGFAGGTLHKSWVTPYGGREPIFSTNPMSFAVPCADEETLLLDFATASIAHGKLMLARAKGVPVPQGMMLDRSGRPSTDASIMDDGAVLLAMGLHKGSGLSLMMEIIPNLLAGQRPVSSPEFRFGNPTLLLAVLPEAFDEDTDFVQHVERLKRRVKKVKPAAGFDEVLLPGEPEARSYAEREAIGIPLPESIWADLCQLARESGLPLPSAVA